jgi:hypothetical protein
MNGIENVGAYAKCCLKAHHGGFERNSYSLIREGSFRFNHRDDENALTYLRSRLHACS